MIKRPIRTAVIDDHIVPYRLAIFNYIADMPEIDLKVFYGTRRLSEREWEIPDENLKYKFRVLKSIVLMLRKKTYAESRWIIFPFTLFFELIVFNPDVVVGYAFSVPTLICVLYCLLFKKSFVSWATGTAHTEKDYSPAQNYMRRKIISVAKSFITASKQGAENFFRFGAERDKCKIVLQVPDDLFIG